MSSANEHARTLFSAILPDRRDLLNKALRHLTTAHFANPTFANLFEMLERYFHITGAVLTRIALDDLLRAARADAGKVALYRELYDTLAATQVHESQFAWSVRQIRESAAERATTAALTEAMEILTRGTETDKGEIIRGHAEARGHVMRRFADIDRDLAMQESPEGDMRTEAEDIIADYQTREAAAKDERNVGVRFGIPALDERIGGLQRGELVLLLGASGEGKTSAVVQLAWSAAIEQGKNVVIRTTETLREQVRRRVIARHSCLSHFDIPSGLNSRDIKNGTLDDAGRKNLIEVAHDFQNNPGYGKFVIVQVPRGATMSYCEAKLMRYAQDFRIDLGIMDYFALLRAERKRTTMREELAEILKDGKQVATSVMDGLGIPFVTPWQVSRIARLEAEKTGAYQSSAASETSEATNSADMQITLMAPLDHVGRIAKVKMQIPKFRDGERSAPFDVTVDYATSCFNVQTPGTTINDAFGLF